MKIRTRVFLSFLIIVAGAFYFLTRWVVDDLRPRYLESAEEPLVDISHVLAALVADRAQESGIDASGLRAAFDEAYKRSFAARIYGLRKRHVDLRVYVTDAMNCRVQVLSRRGEVAWRACRGSGSSIPRSGTPRTRASPRCSAAPVTGR